MGKGSKRRPELSKGAWESNWERVFGKRDTVAEAETLVWNKHKRAVAQALDAMADSDVDARLREMLKQAEQPDPPARVR